MGQRKSERCRRERGFSFADVIPAFADPDRHVEIDDRWEYGEVRYPLYGRDGRVAGRLFVIVYTRRGESARIISARKANARERRRHDESSAEG